MAVDSGGIKTAGRPGGEGGGGFSCAPREGEEEERVGEEEMVETMRGA